MQVNPTTAHPCANTSLNSKTDSLIQKINEAPEWARLLLVGDEFIGVSA